VKIRSSRRIVANKVHATGQRGSVVVNVERAHEYAYQEFGCRKILAHYILNAGCHPFLYDDHPFMGLYDVYVNHCAVGWADEIRSLRDGSYGIPEEPDKPPEQDCADDNQRSYCKDLDD
jgi:hypothetical protein